MTEEIQRWSLATGEARLAGSRNFNPAEAEHVRRILNKEEKGEFRLDLQCQNWPDGHVRVFMGIRREEGEALAPDQFKYVYEAWIYWGSLHPNPHESRIIDAMMRAGFPADKLLWGLAILAK